MESGTPSHVKEEEIDMEEQSLQPQSHPQKREYRPVPRKPIPPLQTAKRKRFSQPDRPIPEGFTVLTSRLMIHSTTGIVVEINKSRIADPTTSYFIARNNSVAVELYKSQRLPYYYITKGAMHPTNWVYLQDELAFEQISKVVEIVPMHICSNCLLVCSEKRWRMHGCDKGSLDCQGFTSRIDSIGLGCAIVTEMPKAEGDVQKNLRVLTDLQQIIINNPTDEVKADEKLWIEERMSEWVEKIDKRRTEAKAKYEKKRNDGWHPLSRQERRDRADLRKKEAEEEEQKKMKEEKATQTAIKKEKVKWEKPIGLPKDTDLSEIPDSMLSSSMLHHINAMQVNAADNFEEEADAYNPYLKDIIHEYLTDKQVCMTLFPYLLLDSIKNGLWESTKPFTDKLRFMLSGKHMALTVYDDKRTFPLKICLKNTTTGTSGWSVEVILSSKDEESAVTILRSANVRFASVCQVIVVFQALVATVYNCFGPSGYYKFKDHELAPFLEYWLEALPCSSTEALKIVGKRFYKQISKWN